MAKVNINPPQLTDKQIQRFWSKVDKSPGHGPNGDCWLWTACRDKDGYGLISLNYQNHRGHRIAYFLTNSEWRGEMNICHDCDNPPCCNPNHLKRGTQAENMAQCSQKGRRAVAAKLQHADIREIRRLYTTGQYTQADISKIYGVHRVTVSKIVRGYLWEHIK